MHVSPERGLRLCEGCAPGEAWRGYEVLWPLTDADLTRSNATKVEFVCDVIREAGIETVQLTAAFGAQRFEIIDCRAPPSATGNSSSHTAACPSSKSPPPYLSTASSRVRDSRGSWLAKRACPCDDARPFLNCGSCAQPAMVTRRAQTSHDSFQVRPPRRR